MVKFSKKMSLWHVEQNAKKVWHAIVVAANQTARRQQTKQLPKNYDMTNL